MTTEQLEELLAAYNSGAKLYTSALLERHAVELARRVIAAEKLVEAYDKYHEIYPLMTGRVQIAVNKARDAYREANK